MVNTLLRVGALVLLRSIFGTRASSRWTAEILLCFSVVYGIAVILAGILICKPIEAAWDPKVPGDCVDQVKVFICAEAVGTALDLAILAFPMLSIIDLSLPLKKKIWVIFILSAGSVYVFISVLLRPLKNHR